MTPPPETGPEGPLARELAYYRRECNDLGARMLRLQEEQAQAYREALRSRTVARMIREAYRLADTGAAPDDIGGPMLEIVAENALCDRTALLREQPPGSGRFAVTHAVGLGDGAVARTATIPEPPAFFFTTARTRLEPPAYELTDILRLPYVLWSYDPGSGTALILGNQSEGNVSRPFEPGDQELVEGALSVYLDVLARRRGEAELRQAKQVAEEASLARARFLATLTHELRTPLNAIIGFSELMGPDSRRPPSAEQRAEYNQHILASARHLLALINEILDYSSLARGGLALALDWVALPRLAAETVGAAQGTATGRGVAIATALPDAPLELRVDRTRFRQVLDNLLSNAVKFTRSGGRVCLSAGREADGGAWIAVRDDGIGMRAADLPRALEPFQQMDNALNRSSPGTGLGLPIAKGLVEAHGGTLALASAPGEGTTVTLRLPAALVRAGAPAATG